LEGGRTILSLFRGQPRVFPYKITMMERHPLGQPGLFPDHQSGLDRRRGSR
jgi:ureidoglycolate lyase